MTSQFPDLTERARGFEQDVILDGEIMAFEDGRKLTFFDLQKRLGRKADVADLFDDKAAFLDALRRARKWSELGKEGFHRALYGHGSGSTEDRLEKGETPSKTGTPDKRLQLARLVIEKTGCPPELFGLSEPEPTAVDQLRREFAQKLVEAKNEVRAEAAKELGNLEALLSSQGIDVPKPK